MADNTSVILNAFCCYYNAVDCKNVEHCLQCEEDCLCCRNACCISTTATPLGCGSIGDKEQGECCKIGAFCCEWGLIKCTTSSLCVGASACLCCYEVASFPLNENYVDKCMLACCFIQCLPTCGCCVESQVSPALVKLVACEIEPITMDRGDEEQKEDDAPAPAADAEVIAEQSKGEDKEMDA